MRADNGRPSNYEDLDKQHAGWERTCSRASSRASTSGTFQSWSDLLAPDPARRRGAGDFHGDGRAPPTSGLAHDLRRRPRTGSRAGRAWAEPTSVGVVIDPRADLKSGFNERSWFNGAYTPNPRHESGGAVVSPSLGWSPAPGGCGTYWDTSGSGAPTGTPTRLRAGRGGLLRRGRRVSQLRLRRPGLSASDPLHGGRAVLGGRPFLPLWPGSRIGLNEGHCVWRGAASSPEVRRPEEAVQAWLGLAPAVARNAGPDRPRPRGLVP